MNKGRKSQIPLILAWFEPVLWTLLSLTAIVCTSVSWSSTVGTAASIYTLAALTKQGNVLPIWRNSNSHSSSTMDPQGRSMLVVLPLLLDAISRCKSEEQQWSLYSKLSGYIMFFSTEQKLMGSVVLGVAAAMDPTLRCWKTVGMTFTWMSLLISIENFPRMHQVLTAGEWRMVSGLVVVVVAEFYSLEPSLHAVVSVAGMMGCVLGCMIASCLRRGQSILIVRAPVLLGIPFVSIETALIWRGYEGLFVPRCISWLVSFLQESEEGNDYPRGVWLLYWAVVLVISFSLAPHHAQSVVVARKWFHFVAMILFGPVTLAAPQLMSLSYAIALALLMVVENLRPWLPTFVQDFYKAFLHNEKDGEDKVVVTHMTLIAGCAMPLWIAEIVGYQGRLMPLWGIVCLGVGDSMGAIVGTKVGKTRWHPYNGRTLEGSLAVWMSMTVSCHLLVGKDEPWVAAVTFVTLLEAWTRQIDNFVLPLAGVTIILMQQCG